MVQWDKKQKPEKIQDMKNSALISVQQTETQHNPF